MTVNNQELVSTNCSKTKKSTIRCWSWQRVNRCLWLGTAVLVLSYLVVANDLAAKSFALRDCKSQLTELRQQQADLQGQVALLSSYDYLRSRVQSLGMVPVDHLPYAVTDDLLAKK